MLKSVLVIIISILLSSCHQLAILTTPKKQADSRETPLSKKAEAEFWMTLHQGRYDNIPQSTQLLSAAYLENPNNPKLAAHLGFIHIWKITERQRLNTIPSTIVDSIILSKKYFQDAVELNSKDARYLGFLGDTQLITGKIFNDQRLQTTGYFTLLDAIHAWPEFNYFTAGYPMTILSNGSTNFEEALDWQWKTLDLCAYTHVDRKNPDFSAYMKFETQRGPQSACWNSWIAPFNFEGFFLNMGDMLVKKGDWKTALIIYHNAMLAKNYSSWPYRFLLENHMRYAKENNPYFNIETHFSFEKPVSLKMRMTHALLFNSGWGCVACHQNH